MRLLSIFVLSCVLGCQSTEERKDLKVISLGSDIVARVGAEMVTVPMLQLAPEGMPQDVALEGLISDVLLSVESRVTMPDRAEVVTRSVLARALYDNLAEATLRAKPPTPRELAYNHKANWLIFDRPRAVRAIDVTVGVDPMAPEQPSYEKAKALSKACRSEANFEDFRKCLADRQGDFNVVMGRLVPLAEDGRVVPIYAQDNPSEELDPEYARHIQSLDSVGAVSDVFALADGFHFLFATEIYEASKMSQRQMREQLRRGIAAGRVKQEVEQLVDSKRAEVAYTPKDLNSLLRLVWRK